jgi:FAD/FMN-containing dehydrogenase
MDRRSFVNATLMGAAGALLRTPGAFAAGSLDRPGALSVADIKDFDASLRGELIRASDSGYDAARRLWNPAFDRRPALIARCSGAADVTRAVQFARAHNLVTAVRGGGHSLSGQSGCDGGLVIDLSTMKGIRIDAVHRRAIAQGGVLLGELDCETQAFGLATTLGTAPDTGIAGLTLGGGFGRLDRRFGLACDNLRAVDIVTADGQLRHASQLDNPDLFWGVRGGGGNFGVVTAFEYQVHPLGPDVLAGTRVFPYSQARNVLAAITEFAQTMPDEMYVAIFVTRNEQAPSPGIVVGYEVCYSGSPAIGAKLLAPLQRLGQPLYDDVAVKTYVAAQGGTGKVKAVPSDSITYFKSGFVGDASPLLLDEIVRRFAASPPVVQSVVLLSHGGVGGRVKPEATAFWNRWMKYTMLLVGSWTERAQHEANLRTARAFWEAFDPYTRNYYPNTDVNDDEQRLRATYGGNYARLVKLKDKYDPANLFRLNANIKPTVRS